MRQVGFRHARPTSPAVLEAYLRALGVAPTFLEESNSIDLDGAALDEPIASADPALSRIVERHAETLLAALPAPTTSTADRVRRTLAQALRDGDASLASIAAKLRMSERSLQRGLARASLRFELVLDALRRDLALSYLADPKIAIAEVAYLLGYSEPSPFHRAFKRWTGKTPAEARRSCASPPGT